MSAEAPRCYHAGETGRRSFGALRHAEIQSQAPALPAASREEAQAEPQVVRMDHPAGHGGGSAHDRAELPGGHAGDGQAGQQPVPLSGPRPHCPWLPDVDDMALTSALTLHALSTAVST